MLCVFLIRERGIGIGKEVKGINRVEKLNIVIGKRKGKVYWGYKEKTMVEQ